MNAEQLLKHYEQVAEAPDAIARLRRFVLDLAVRGKLAAQDSNDEPASTLLQKIAAERVRRVAAGEISKEKPVTGIAADEAPYVCPPGWEWARIRSVASSRGQKIPDADFTYIDVTSINKEIGRIENPAVVTAADAPSRARKLVARGDVLYSCVRPYLLNIAVVDSDLTPPPIASTAFAVLNGLGLVLPRYQWIVLRSPFFVDCVEGKMRGQAYPAINDSDFALLPFPLPPLAEQHRIVAKVDELMSLCDRLEVARAQREAARDRLTASTLARLNTPESPASPDGDASKESSFQSDARFALKVLPTLTNCPDQIKLLRQTVLNLAVCGRLSPENGPSEMLAEKYLLEPSSPDLPCGWRLLNFGRFCDIEGGNQPPKSQFIDEPRNGYVRLLQIRDLGEKPVPTFIPLNSTNRFCKRGEILIGRYGASVGKIFWAQDGAYNVALAKFIWPADAWISAFAFLLLKSEYFQSRLSGASRSAQAGFNKGDLAGIDLPLPPLAEQPRIVAKVDELMAICAKLEASLTRGENTRSRLLNALLHEALAPAESVLEAA